ncbi:MAG: insulinase family protein [Candidatus Aminicenantes bacterium]|nr:insulinase family protein [Candidatus Aminicenantes bacterium]
MIEERRAPWLLRARRWAWGLVLLAAPTLPARSAPARFDFPVTTYQLRNGLQVLLTEDHSLPLVSVVVAYRVGSSREDVGRSGCAYLLQKLMFQGSQNIGPLQHIAHIGRVGGDFNATTSEDLTFFYQTVPANQLPLVLWLESDRMRLLDIRTEAVERVRAGLIEEIIERRTSEPYWDSNILFDQSLFPDFSYSHPVIGTEEDVLSLSLDEIAGFYADFYAPNNALLCLSGDFQPMRARELIARYFETLPPGRDIPPPPVGGSRERGGLSQTVRNFLAPTPGFHLGFRIPGPGSREFAILTVLDYILMRGETSRIRKRILHKERLALELIGGVERRRDRAAFRFFAVANNDVMVERCQNAILSELGKIKTAFIGQDELLRAKAMLRMDMVRRVSTSLDRALYLCESVLLQPGFGGFAADLDAYLSVTPSEIIGVANRYLKDTDALGLNIQK